jgi:hypothetical protein
MRWALAVEDDGLSLVAAQSEGRPW